MERGSGRRGELSSLCGSATGGPGAPAILDVGEGDGEGPVKRLSY